jgi:single-strand DNA-binding protein
MNKVQLIGNLGNKPEIKNFENGGKMAKFSVATSEEYVTRKGEKATETQWHLVTAWGKLVDTIESDLDKGSRVSIEGRLSHRNYVDKDGNKKYITEIIANEVLLKSKSNV